MQNGLDVSIDQVSPADERSMQLHRILQNPSFCIEVGLAVMKWKLRPGYIELKAHDHLKSWTTKCWHIPRQENQGCENPSLHLLHFSSRPAEYKMSGTKLFTIKSCHLRYKREENTNHPKVFQGYAATFFWLQQSKLLLQKKQFIRCQCLRQCLQDDAKKKRVLG